MDASDDHTYSKAPSQIQVSGGATAVFTMREAAEVVGVSVSTLRRRRADLIAAGAVIEASGWKVPITALIAAGLISGEGERPARPEAALSEQTHTDSSIESETKQLRDQVRELEQQVAEWRRRAEVAEARAEERGQSLESRRVANETERMALRMLTSSVPSPTNEPPAASIHSNAPQPTPPSEPAQQRPTGRSRGFLHRLFTD